MKKIVRRGDVYWVRSPLDTLNNEMGKKRPAVIVSNDKNNQFSNNVEICYMTTADKKYLPTHVRTGITGAASTILCENVYTVGKDRLESYIVFVPDHTMEAVDRALMISLGLDGVLLPSESLKKCCETLRMHQLSCCKTQEDLLKSIGGV